MIKHLKITSDFKNSALTSFYQQRGEFILVMASQYGMITY
jgi:hypothetical protein